MAIQGAGKPGNQTNQVNQSVTGGPTLGGMARLGDAPPDFAGQAMKLIGAWMGMFASPKVEDKKEAKAENTKEKEKEKEGEVKKGGKNEAAAEVEDPMPSPTAADAKRMVADADALRMAVDTDTPYLPQFYGRTVDDSSAVDDRRVFGSNFDKVDTTLHLDAPED